MGKSIKVSAVQVLFLLNYEIEDSFFWKLVLNLHSTEIGLKFFEMWNGEWDQDDPQGRVVI